MNILPEETLRQPDALGNIFAEMHKARKVPMTEEQSRYMINILMSSNDGVDEMFKDMSSQFPFSGFFNRCSIFPIKYEKKLLVWLALMTYETNIGGMILVAYYTQWAANDLKEKYITVKNEVEGGPLSLQTVTEKIFPYGIFDKETVHEFWDKQKVKAQPDNLVDHLACQQSFMKVPEPA